MYILLTQRPSSSSRDVVEYVHMHRSNVERSPEPATAPAHPHWGWLRSFAGSRERPIHTTQTSSAMSIDRPRPACHANRVWEGGPTRKETRVHAHQPPFPASLVVRFTLSSNKYACEPKPVTAKARQIIASYGKRQDSICQCFDDVQPYVRRSSVGMTCSYRAPRLSLAAHHNHARWWHAYLCSIGSRSLACRPGGCSPKRQLMLRFATTTYHSD